MKSCVVKGNSIGKNICLSNKSLFLIKTRIWLLKNVDLKCDTMEIQGYVDTNIDSSDATSSRSGMSHGGMIR